MNQRLNVYEQTQRRLERIFSSFDYVYVSFSGGKDSSVLLNLCIDYMRSHGITRKLGVFHIDYEIQYRETLRHIDDILAAHADILEVYRICVPFKVTTCTSMFQQYWRPWDENKCGQWIREMPEGCYTREDFPFYTDEMWDYEFQNQFSQWVHQRQKAQRTCCLIGIRTQESLNRWRAVHSYRNYRCFQNLKWIRYSHHSICNAYPIYDWQTTDVWTANGKFRWSYNRLYDLYYQAGVPLDKQRVASPFISQAQTSLKLYRVIDPDTWGKMLNRVNGVNFTSIYGGTSAVGWMSVKLPEGFTWSGYLQFLLSSLPEEARRNYEEKLSVSIDFWRNTGGCLSDETIEKLKQEGVPIIVGKQSRYKKSNKRPVRMEYMDDIHLPEFRELPTFKRMCICILKNDHACKYMGFSPNKIEKERRERMMEKYRMLQ